MLNIFFFMYHTACFYFSEAEASKTAEDSMCGPVPQKYFVVRNSDLVQLRYLLVYGKNPHPVLW